MLYNPPGICVAARLGPGPLGVIVGGRHVRGCCTVRSGAVVASGAAVLGLLGPGQHENANFSANVTELLFLAPLTRICYFRWR